MMGRQYADMRMTGEGWVNDGLSLLLLSHHSRTNLVPLSYIPLSYLSRTFLVPLSHHSRPSLVPLSHHVRATFIQLSYHSRTFLPYLSTSYHSCIRPSDRQAECNARARELYEEAPLRQGWPPLGRPPRIRRIDHVSKCYANDGLMVSECYANDGRMKALGK